MTIDLVCPSCGRMLRIGSEHAGKQIRCPACQEVSISPAADAAALPSAVASGAADADAQNATLWYVRTPEGAVYGPIRWEVVLAWAEEGRVADDCELGNGPDGPWQLATQFIPGLGSSVHAPAAAAGSPEKPPHDASQLQQPFAPTWPSAPAGGGGYVAPHRGPLVLIMGILGFFVGCPVFSVIAWILGSRDLREIRAGRMDASGETMTQVGMILGMVLSILWLVGTFLLLTVFLVAVGMQL